MGRFGTYNLKIFTLSKIIFCLLIFFNVFNYKGEGFFFTGKGAILEFDDGKYTQNRPFLAKLKSVIIASWRVKKVVFGTFSKFLFNFFLFLVT